jgi:hypothetical protein
MMRVCANMLGQGREHYSEIENEMVCGRCHGEEVEALAGAETEETK